MDDRIIRLCTPDNLGVPDSLERIYDSVNVIRQEYTDDLMAYFVRSRAGTLLFVNATYSLQDQAKAISSVIREIEKCGIVEAGVLKKNFEYICGGTCCNENQNSRAI